MERLICDNGMLPFGSIIEGQWACDVEPPTCSNTVSRSSDNIEVSCSTRVSSECVGDVYLSSTCRSSDMLA